MMTKADLEDENSRLNGLLNAAKEAASVVSEEFAKTKRELEATKNELAYQKSDSQYFARIASENADKLYKERQEAQKAIQEITLKAAETHVKLMNELKLAAQAEIQAERARCDTMADVFDRTLQTLANLKK